MSDQPRTIRVTAPSRLHFGLLSLPGEQGRPTHWPDLAGDPTIPARHFGGVGLMIDAPTVRVAVRPAGEWSADGPAADRALAFARRAAAALGIADTYHVTVEACPPEHTGLGTGTQLGLSVAYALSVAAGHDPGRGSIPSLAAAVGRGKRSGLGVHGFEHGGFLVEGGKDPSAPVAPLLARYTFPADWRILLVCPAGLRGTHGAAEAEAFARLAAGGTDLRQTEAMTRLVLLGMLPALLAADLPAFGEALYDYNRRAGALFAPYQGGLYAHPCVAELVDLIRRAGVPGVGQSSWGPTVFAVVDVERAHQVANGLARSRHVSPQEIHVVEPSRGMRSEQRSV